MHASDLAGINGRYSLISVTNFRLLRYTKTPSAAFQHCPEHIQYKWRPHNLCSHVRTQSRVFLESFQDIQANVRSFMESSSSFPCPQQPTTGSYPQPHKSSLHPHTLLKIRVFWCVMSQSGRWLPTFWNSGMYVPTARCHIPEVCKS